MPRGTTPLLLREDGRTPVAELSRRLGVARATVTGRLDRLVASGIIVGFSVRVRDEGCSFDPSCLPDPLAPENILKSSGRGIFLINGLMDEVQFADGGRELQMRKRKA